ncbi:MAG: DUF1552 domain-containing protein [Deltaproteobacteria bacterium]|nr:DUF1552 domain-containing protein [Deltaproteobacteria bacterium]
MKGLDRRALLRGLGLGAASLPLLAEGLARPARAADSGFPTRLVVVVMPNGVRHDTFWPRTVGDLVIDAGPNSSLAPLKPFEKKLLVVGGLALTNMYDAKASWAHSSTPFVLTAAPGAPFEGAWDGMKFTGGAPSIDLHVAKQLKAQGVQSPVSSLVLRTGEYRGNDSYLSIAGPPINNKVNAPTPDTDPKSLFTRLFGNLDLTSDAASRGKAEDAAVLAHASRRLDVLAKRVGKQNASTVAAHWDAVAALKTRVMGSGGTGCMVPAAPSGYAAGEVRYQGRIARAFSDITVAALRCDLTRVACIGWTGDSWQFSFPANGEAQVQDANTTGPYKDEHGIAHDVSKGPEAVRQKQLVDRWFAGEFAYLLQAMDNVKEGDGTMLDHSIVVLANQMSDGYWHSANDIPFVIAGGGNGKLKPGRLVRYVPGAANKSYKPHSGLLLDLCHAMGVDGAGLQAGPYDGAYGVLG